jgi:hypothetical protein
MDVRSFNALRRGPPKDLRTSWLRRTRGLPEPGRQSGRARRARGDADPFDNASTILPEPEDALAMRLAPCRWLDRRGGLAPGGHLEPGRELFDAAVEVAGPQSGRGVAMVTREAVKTSSPALPAQLCGGAFVAW